MPFNLGFAKIACARQAAIIVLLFVALSATAQSPADQPIAFDVASIRTAATQTGSDEVNSRSQVECAADGLVMRNISLSEMIQWAYGLNNDQVVGPSALQDQRYDVSAKTSGPVSESTLRRMLQDLVTTRFKVQFRRDHKKSTVYELVVAKGGPRLPQNKEASLPNSYPKESLPRAVNGDFVFRNVTIADFATQLTQIRGIDFPVVDRTGIKGVYDITLKSAASVVRESGGADLPILIQEQLGLKLVSTKEPVEVLVIDHFQKPSDN